MTKVNDKVLATIRKNRLINKGDHIVLGLSGGPDSVCLFFVLLGIAEEMELTIEAVHINHKFRPGEAEADQTYVEELCRQKGIRCWSFVEDCNQVAAEFNLGPEEAGRKVRYDSFTKVALAIAAEGTAKDKIKITVAQNLNDQAETLLFRILRGTGTDGLSGIEYLRRDRSGFLIIRPLLDVERKDIEAYCEERQVNPCRDKTNEESIYTRNKIRLDLLPYLEKNFNGNVREALNRLCQVSREDKDFIWQRAVRAFEELFISETEGICSLNREGLKASHPAIRHRVLIKAFEKIGLYKDISYAHLEAADKLIERGKTPAQIDFPGGFILRISYGKVECCSSGSPETPVEMKLKASILYKEDYMEREGTAIFDVDKMAEVYDFAGGPLSLIFARTREPGDYIKLSVGSKTIQDLFVDMKVPKDLRDTIFMAAIGNEILWIPEGVTKARFSNNFKVTEETKKVLILEMDCEL
ncbi:MAG: tRNA lysidine(34) synthetase TilS [Anaerovoracaceae bacterium]